MWIAGFDKNIDADDLRVRQVRYLLDGKQIATVDGNPEQAWTSESYLSEHRFPTAGLRKLSAIVVLEDGTTLKSDALEVRADHDVEKWMRDNLDQMTANVLDGTSVTITASSSAADHPARAALDHLHATAWICAARAKNPKLELRWRKPVRADRIVLYPASSNMPNAEHFDQVQRIAVTINSRRTEVICPEDPLAPTIIGFGSNRAVRAIEIQILQRRPGTKHPGLAGFSEVALQLAGN